jgi:hypothetical protein
MLMPFYPPGYPGYFSLPVNVMLRLAHDAPLFFEYHSCPASHDQKAAYFRKHL